MEDTNTTQFEIDKEAVRKRIDAYFAEQFDSTKMTSGDLAPEQEFALDQAVETIAKLVSQWREQNKILEYECINDGTKLDRAEDGYSCPKCGCHTIAPEEDGMYPTNK